MDAVTRLHENLLSCTICTDRFTDPSTLGCGHTFCKECLTKYIETQQDAIRAKSIRCPVCKQLTKTPNPTEPAEEWSSQLKPHFLIQGLLEAISSLEDSAQGVSATTGDGLCLPCQKIGKTVEAGCLCQDCEVTLCEDCVKIHTSIPGTSHHSISEVNVNGRLNAFCREHKQPVDYCCKDCNKAICNKCCVIYHRKCKRLVTIESMATEMKSVVKETKWTIMTTLVEIQTNLAIQQSTIDAVEQNKASVLSEISRVSQQAIDEIKEKEKQLMDELEDLTAKRTGQLKSQIKTGEVDRRMYQQYSEFMDQALACESDMDLYDVYRMCQSGAVKSADEKERDPSPGLSQEKVMFVDQLEPQGITRKFELGRLKLVHDNSDLTKKPTLQDTIDIMTGDEDPCPTDVIVMDVDGVDTVVVTNWNSKCLKSFYTRDTQRCSNTLRLNHQPHSVVKLGHKQVVVSFQSHKELIIVQVTPDLALLNTIKTHKAYGCLTVLTPSTLAAGCRDPPGIDIIDVKGKVIRSLTPRHTNLKLEYPHLLCTTNKGHILVSDCDSKAVHCLTEKGEVVFTYRPDEKRELSDPCGITTDPTTGAIVVVDYENEKVIQLTETGHFLWNLLTTENGLQSPHGICLFRDKLYITEYGKGTIKCFTFRDLRPKIEFP